MKKLFRYYQDLGIHDIDIFIFADDKTEAVQIAMQWIKNSKDWDANMFSLDEISENTKKFTPDNSGVIGSNGSSNISLDNLFDLINH